MDWEGVEAHNVYGYLPGSPGMLPAKSREKPQSWQDQTIVIQAYYDAISVVPALAPGAENAAGIVALLQLVELLKEYRPHYSILFLATSGHFEGLSGINDFLYRHSRRSDYFRERMSEAERIDFDLMLSLDLSSHADRTASFGMGTFYNPKWRTDNYVKYMLTPYSKRLSLAVEETFGDTTRHYEGIAPPKAHVEKTSCPCPLAFASEAAALRRSEGPRPCPRPMTRRERIDTPLDLPEAVDTQNLTRQIQTLAAMLAWAGRGRRVAQADQVGTGRLRPQLGGRDLLV